MVLTKDQKEKIETAVKNVCLYELGLYDKTLTPFENSFRNPKVYTKEPSAAYTDYVVYNGPRKNVKGLYINSLNTMVNYSWISSLKIVFKKQIKEQLNVTN